MVAVSVRGTYPGFKCVTVGSLAFLSDVLQVSEGWLVPFQVSQISYQVAFRFLNE